MKNLYSLIIITTLLLLGACKSVEKLVDQGNYDEAIVLATKKLAGKKKKKTKHVMALEEAFGKINKRDLDHIRFLKSKSDPSTWETIYNYALKIQERQHRVSPFLPLVSKNGYVGYFELIDVQKILLESGKGASEYYYDIGSSLLEDSKRTNNKLLARKAFNAFVNTKRFFNNFKDVDIQIDESRRQGTIRLLQKWDESFVSLSGPYWNFRSNPVVDYWTIYYTEFEDDIDYDIVSTLRIKDVYISPESERVNTFIESKEREFWVDAVDRDGEIITDTLGNTIQVKQIEKLSAFITEHVRIKDARVEGVVETIDFMTGNIIARDEFVHDIHFRSDACSFVGDREALSSNSRKRIDLNLLAFPADDTMIFEGLEKMNDNFRHHLKKLDLEDFYFDNIVSTF